MEGRERREEMANGKGKGEWEREGEEERERGEERKERREFFSLSSFFLRLPLND